MPLATNLPIGTRVRYVGNDSNANTLRTDDLGTIVGVDPNRTYYGINMDDSHGRPSRDLTATSSHGHWNTSGARWEVVDAPDAPAVLAHGVKGKIVGNDHRHFFDMGEVVTILRQDEYESSSWRAKNDAGTEWWISASDVEIISTAPAAAVSDSEALQAYRLDFLVRAHARGAYNGLTHQGQVERALDRLAGMEYLDPSPTLEAFQQRIVTLAMDKKAEHRWCGEPEAFLTEFGLAHLLPVRKSITVLVTVEVTGDANTTTREWQDRAAALVPHENGSYAPRSAYTVENGL